MLSELYIRDFAIVHTLELSFGPGFTVLTGETGAGKSILIDALALALGERADGGVIRQGCARTEVIARFSLETDHAAARWLAAHDLFEEQECVLRRVVEAEKPSKGFINGRPAAMQMLRELGELLVDIHGQHEHQSLLRRDAQRELLDGYASLGPACSELARLYEELHGFESRLSDLSRQSADRVARLELLRYQVRELETLNLAADEVRGLEEEHARLANGQEILQGTQEIAYSLYEADEGSLSSRLAQTISKLETLSGFDPKLGHLLGALNQASVHIDEVASELRQYADALDLDPERLQWLDQRLASAHDLARKHRVNIEELPHLTERLRQELSDIEDFDINQDKLKEKIAVLRKEYLGLASEISAKRATAAKRLAAAVGEQVQQIGMPGGRFEVALTPLPEGQLNRHGLEQIEFMVSANPGQPLKPLAKVASGGELSRISLALQVVASGLSQVPTLIFDEVDVGIGGAVAEIVGQQLHSLGQSAQVLCVTHLGQVAAQGDHHLQVTKAARNGATVTHIHALGKKERVQEIARMIGGVEISAQTLALASDMLAHVNA